MQGHQRSSIGKECTNEAVIAGKQLAQLPHYSVILPPPNSNASQLFLSLQQLRNALPPKWTEIRQDLESPKVLPNAAILNHLLYCETAFRRVDRFIAANTSAEQDVRRALNATSLTVQQLQRRWDKLLNDTDDARAESGRFRRCYCHNRQLWRARRLAAVVAQFQRMLGDERWLSARLDVALHFAKLAASKRARTWHIIDYFVRELYRWCRERDVELRRRAELERLRADRRGRAFGEERDRSNLLGPARLAAIRERHLLDKKRRQLDEELGDALRKLTADVERQPAELECARRKLADLLFEKESTEERREEARKQVRYYVPNIL